MKRAIETTVIIPTHNNRIDFLFEAINSVFSNTYKPKIIIIVVDNNINYFNTIKNRIKDDENINIIHNSTNRKGASATRNYAAQYVKTKYISFLDDDDSWEENYLYEVFNTNDFDVALTGFKKKKEEKMFYEKLPPYKLKPKLFFIKNPGIRGSNITITKKLFYEVGGFNENLLSFNDMDFGIKISINEGLIYKSIQKHLVIFNSHSGKRISTAGSLENIQGLTEFLIIHGDKMSSNDEEKYRERAIKLWNIDPYNIEYLETRFKRVCIKKELFNAHFPNILNGAEILLHEKKTYDNQCSRIQNFLKKLRLQYSKFNSK